MANRYWVGGTGSWDASTATNWSATSGGTGGASAPTLNDDVYLDSNSGVGTITAVNATCRSFYCTNPTTGSYSGTIVFGTASFQSSLFSYGDFILSPSMTLTMTQLVYFYICQGNGFMNVNFAGKGVGATYTFVLGSSNSTVNLLSDITRNDTQTGVEFYIYATLITNNYNVAIRADNGNAFVYFGMTNRSRLGSSVFDIQAGTVRLLNTSSAVWESSTLLINRYQSPVSSTNIVIDTGSSATIGRLRIITPTVITGNIAIGACTIVAAPTVTQFQGTVNFAANSTGYPIIENLSSESTAGNRRVLIASSTYGLTQTFAVNGTTNLTDVDFRDVNVIGKSSPISGTRIGNRGNTTGISFTPAKNVYSVYNGGAAVSWYDNIWSLSPGGSASLNNFPLAQDTVVVQNNSLTQIILQSNAAGNFVGSIDMSARTSALTVTLTNSYTCYGNWKNGSGISFSSSSGITFSGGNTQTITSAGKTFTCSITVDTYGGTVQLADALNIGTTSQVYVTNGTFTTVGYAVTAGTLLSNNSNVRTINLGASTVTLSGTVSKITCTTTTNLTFNAGTSNIIVLPDAGGNWGVIDCGPGLNFYDMSVTGDFGSIQQNQILGACTFRNLTIVKQANDQINRFSFNSNITVTGTLTISSTTAVRRIILHSTIIGTRITITAGAFAGADCDFQDINLAGAASGASPTRAGDCGNNLGITFPAAKTVYWNLAGTQNWSAIGWATSSGGTPAVNNFPLAQDTAVFNNAGSAGTVTIERNWNIGTFDASGRTSAMTLSTSTIQLAVYGDWKFGTGVTSSSTTGTLTFSKNNTQTITSNGVQFGCPIIINNPLAYVQLADALSLGATRTLTLTAGTFDAVTYNVTTGLFSNSSTSNTLKMGSGTWTLSGTGTVWNCTAQPTLIVGTSTIVLSDTSTSSRTFTGGGLYYNKLTIGGTAGTSTLAITGDNTFGELASTKTVAHTITFGTTIQTFGKWGVTGTLGNVVTLTGTSTSNAIAGPAVTGVDYLAMGTWGIRATSPAEFYAGANSTGTATAPVFRTAAPSPRTLYWVGGTGNWSSTTKWSTSSNGASGSAIPTSLDSVIFDSASNATAYTATIDAGVTIARCAAFTMAGPASGNVTFAGTIPIAFHGNVSFPATGITNSYTGRMYLVGSQGGSYVFNCNNATLGADDISFDGFGLWTLGSAVTIGSGKNFSLNSGSFDTAGYTVTGARVLVNGASKRSLTLGASNIINTTLPFTVSSNVNFTFNAGTSTITGTSSANAGITSPGLTFNNVSFTNAAAVGITITGANTFNNLTFTGLTAAGINPVTFSDNQTINGTLTIGASSGSAYRTFLRSNIIGTPRTLTCAAISSVTDIDFRDINIANAISSIAFNTPGSGTWTVPAGVTSATIKLWGGGGGSGGQGYIDGGGGGGGGAFASKVLTVTPAQVLSFTVGAGGGAGGYNGFGQTVGTAGVSSTHSTITAGGGGGGGDGTGGTGGTSSGGDVNTSGQSGFYGGSPFNQKGGLAGNSPNALANSAVSPYSGLQPGGGQGGGGTDFTGSGGAGRITFEWSAITLPVTGTRLGNCKGNSNITFDAGKTVYYRQTSTSSWGTTGTGSWSLTSGGAFDATAFPLAQDTAVFPAATYPALGAVTTINADYNIGTIDMSLRTTNTMTIGATPTSFSVYGNWINGSGTAFSINQSCRITFAGRTTQGITTAGKTWTASLTIETPGGSVVLQDNFIFSVGTTNTNPDIKYGTFDANGYNVTVGTTGNSYTGMNSTGTNVRTINFGSGTWTVLHNGTFMVLSGSNLTLSGTATINVTSTSSTGWTPTGNMSGMTLNLGGPGQVSFNSDCTIGTITRSYTAAATTLNLSNTNLRVGAFTAAGTAGKLLTIIGSSLSSPATLIYTGAGAVPTLAYVTPTYVKAYPLISTWSADANSTAAGALGFTFPVVVNPKLSGNFMAFF
jgi:hypothetical protein